MTLAGGLITIAIVLLWTGVRETLMERYAHYKHPRATLNSGLIVFGLYVVSVLIIIVSL